MRRSYTLSAANPAIVADLPFTPSTILIMNNTDKSVYTNIGRAVIPNATFFDMETLPTSNGIPSNVALPNNSNLFAMYLPTPTDTTKKVVVTFQGTSDPFSNRVAFPTRGSIPIPGGGSLSGLGEGGVGSQLMGGGKLKNYQMFRLNSRNLRQVMELSWFSDMMFVLNNTDAWTYIREGGVSLPSASYSDIPIPPKSYTILNPHGGFQFSAYLDSPTEKDCFIIFAYGYADEYMAYKELFGDWDWYLPPLLVPQFNWNFDFIPSRWCQLFDFTLSNFSWMITAGTWVSGTGFVAANTVPPAIYQLAISSSPNPFGDCNADTLTIYYQLLGVNGGQANNWRALKHPATNVQTFTTAILVANNEITFALNGNTINGCAFSQLNSNTTQLIINGFALEGDVIGGVPPVFNYGTPC